MYGKLSKMTLAFALLASPVILSGCGGSAEVTQAVTTTPSAAPTASPTPAPELKNFSVKDKTQEYLENFGTSAWNDESSKEIAENIRIKAREDKENTFTYLEIADSIEKNDVQNVKKLFTKIGGVLPASVAARYPDPTPTPDETAAPATPAPAKDEAIHLKGKKDQATEFFHLNSGIAILEATDNGDSNFVIYLYDETGDYKKLIVNEIGPYKGKSLVVLPEEGKFMLKVESDGSWKVDIKQSIPDNIKSAPIKLSGKGNDVVFAKLQSKLTRFTSKHTGESNFAVKLNDSLLLVNEIGNYSGSTAEKIESDGIYVFSVEADGQWSIDIE